MSKSRRACASSASRTCVSRFWPTGARTPTSASTCPEAAQRKVALLGQPLPCTSRVRAGVRLRVGLRRLPPFPPGRPGAAVKPAPGLLPPPAPPFLFSPPSSIVYHDRVDLIPLHRIGVQPHVCGPD